jgi:hypothetical protein
MMLSLCQGDYANPTTLSQQSGTRNSARIRQAGKSKIFRSNAVDFHRPVRRTSEGERPPMQYLLLIYDNETRWQKATPSDINQELGNYRAFGAKNAGAILGGNALQPTDTARTVRVRDGKAVTTDGPFAETKEQLGGYYLVEAKDADEAAHIASQIPGARFGCIEVRPIMTFNE